MKTKKPVSKELSEYFSKIGTKGGNNLKEKRGVEYYREIRKRRKNYPKLKKVEEPENEQTEEKI